VVVDFLCVAYVDYLCWSKKVSRTSNLFSEKMLFVYNVLKNF